MRNPRVNGGFLASYDLGFLFFFLECFGWILHGKDKVYVVFFPYLFFTNELIIDRHLIN